MKKTSKSEKIVSETETVIESNISELTTDFGRADLNELRDKINEVIRSK